MNINDEFITKVIRLNNEGKGVSIINGVVTFIDKALVNETLKVKIDKINKNYMEASIIQIIEESKDRIKPICPYYNKCGGCNLMHMSSETILSFKKDKVKNIFKKISNEEINIDKIYSYNELNYRNKVVFKVKEDKIGFYKNKSNELIDIDYCFICDELINKVLKVIKVFIKENINHNIKEIMIRTCNSKIMLSLDNLNSDLKDKFIKKFNIIDSIYINNTLVYGSKNLIQTLNNFNFYVSEKSFFQVNIKTIEKLYDYALSKVCDSKTLLDLYSGTGTISILSSSKSKKVIGIEVIPSAVKDANENLKLNNIKNVKFILGKVEDNIEKIKKENVDYLILDPPRSGSDKKSLRNILEINPKKIIYISCNPVTLARDYNSLKDKYDIEDIALFDMFPNTHHIESLLVLERK